MVYQGDKLLTCRPVTAAVGWLEEVEEKSLDEIKAADAKAETDPNTVPADLKPGEEAKSLVCGECGRKLRSHAQGTYTSKMLASYLALNLLVRHILGTH